jgi:hypothetical protein
MVMSNDGEIGFACQFNLKLLEDWKMLCAMFKSEKWLEMFAESKSGEYYQTYDERPAIVPVNFIMIHPYVPSPRPSQQDNERKMPVDYGWEWKFEKLAIFFNSIESRLSDGSDLKVLHDELLNLKTSYNDHESRLNHDAVFNVQVFGSFAHASIGTRDFYKESQSFSSLANHVALLASLDCAFREIGVPDHYVKMKLIVCNN